MAPADSAASALIQVEVVFSQAPRQVACVALNLPLGNTVKDALLKSGFMEQAQGLSLGIWGRKATLTQVLHDRDRVEIYRALKVDPKEARRVRYRAHGEKLPKGVRRPKARPVPEKSD
ncbi:MAG: RnfH family protein [Rubrivivax sp.]|nr:MAG: RnfH family protein [Rubrivivax sp.]